MDKINDFKTLSKAMWNLISRNGSFEAIALLKKIKIVNQEKNGFNEGYIRGMMSTLNAQNHRDLENLNSCLFLE